MSAAKSHRPLMRRWPSQMFNFFFFFNIEAIFLLCEYYLWIPGEIFHQPEWRRERPASRYIDIMCVRNTHRSRAVSTVRCLTTTWTISTISQVLSAAAACYQTKNKIRICRQSTVILILSRFGYYFCPFSVQSRGTQIVENLLQCWNFSKIWTSDLVSRTPESHLRGVIKFWPEVPIYPDKNRKILVKVCAKIRIKFCWDGTLCRPG